MSVKAACGLKEIQSSVLGFFFFFFKGRKKLLKTVYIIFIVKKKKSNVNRTIWANFHQNDLIAGAIHSLITQ